MPLHGAHLRRGEGEELLAREAIERVPVEAGERDVGGARRRGAAGAGHVEIEAARRLLDADALDQRVVEEPGRGALDLGPREPPERELPAGVDVPGERPIEAVLARRLHALAHRVGDAGEERDAEHEGLALAVGEEADGADLGDGIDQRRGDAGGLDRVDVEIEVIDFARADPLGRELQERLELLLRDGAERVGEPGTSLDFQAIDRHVRHLGAAIAQGCPPVKRASCVSAAASRNLRAHLSQVNRSPRPGLARSGPQNEHCSLRGCARYHARR